MHPRIVAVIDVAERARAELLATVDQLPSSLQEARPTEEAWSVAEVLEHLVRVEKGIVRLIELRVAEMRAMPTVPMESGDYIAVDPKRFAVLSDRTQQIQAPERVAPQGEWTAAEAREHLTASRSALFAALAAGDGLALSSFTHPHLVLGELDLYEWVYLVAAHELRHAAQIRAVSEFFYAS
jgi:hypothetical protein